MILLEKALSVLEGLNIGSMPAERVNLEEALNRVLAEDLQADSDFPSFNKSAMDGYAIRKEDIDNQLHVVEFIPAGKAPEKVIEQNTCSKIMTGAMIPEGADMVVMKEHVEVVGDQIVITNKESRTNILYRGEDIKSGTLLLEKGTLIQAVHTGILASNGVMNPLVYKMPVMSVISTGDELVSPDIKPVAPQIRNSNSVQLTAMAKLAGAEAIDHGIVADDIDKIYQKVESALQGSDVVILTGGASVGDLDFTGAVFEQLKAEIHFTKLAIQPGKPLLLATVHNKVLFGLSGNPVSSFVQFQLLVKPLLDRLTSMEISSHPIQLPMAGDHTRKRSERMLFFPVRINKNMEVETIEYHGSAHLNAYQQAEGMAAFPIGINILKKGTIVDVRPL